MLAEFIVCVYEVPLIVTYHEKFDHFLPYAFLLLNVFPQKKLTSVT